jgi:ribosomal protein S27E
MVVMLKHIGYAPNSEQHHYIGMTAAGVVRRFEDECFLPSGSYNLREDQWGSKSGWVNWQCDKCRAEFWTLATPGEPITCLCCGDVDTVPLGAIVQEDKYD